MSTGKVTDGMAEGEVAEAASKVRQSSSMIRGVRCPQSRRGEKLGR